MQENRVTADISAKQSEELSRPKGKKKKQSRSTPAMVKWMIAIVLIIGSGFVGLSVGYSYIGKGSIGDAFDLGTYKHMYDLVFKTNS